jgi:3-hydroxyacyl-[acyl-carrier-protein] dehydratase
MIDHRFHPDHPTAAGHFPGNPIIPGALVLDHVVRAIGIDGPVEIQVAKFLGPVRPGDRVAIRWRRQEGGIVAFECRLTERDVLALSGTVKLGAAS